MSRDTEFPDNWASMSSAQRSKWLALWFDGNVSMHQEVAKMEREKAEAAWKNYRKKNGRGKRRK